MTFLLDINICIYLANRSNAALGPRIARHHASDFGMSAITAAELAYGVARSAHRTANARKLELLRSEFTVLPFDAAAVDEYGLIRAALEKRGTPIGPLDTLIAAHAVAADLTLVTNNVREFRRVRGLRVENWTESVA